MDIKDVLESVAAGALSPTAALAALKDWPLDDLGFAKIDRHRALRKGFPETVYCASKSAEQITAIFASAKRRGEALLGTRCSAGAAESACAAMDDLVYDAPAGMLYLPGSGGFDPFVDDAEDAGEGRILICTAGTSDHEVAREAACCCRFFGSKVETLFDVGVAGLHRLLGRLDALRSAKVVIAIAGMDGALPSVIAGLSDKPVIALPTSVGYGASFGGVSALLTMLNSCAEGLSVVNIDNGFGAAYLAVQINRLAVRGDTQPPTTRTEAKRSTEGSGATSTRA